MGVTRRIRVLELCVVIDPVEAECLGSVFLVDQRDRLAVDIARSEVALAANDNKAANDHLQHAQRIVRMLRNALQPDGFEGGQELLSVYVFLENHLVRANLEKNGALVRECAELVQPIHEAWTRAVRAHERDNVTSYVG